MKKLLYILIILLLGCVPEKENFQEMTIQGKITGKIPERIEYTIPINGISYVGFENAVQPDSLGNFTISLVIDKASFIELSDGHKAYGTIIAEPEMNYDVSIAVEEKKNKFTIKGPNQKGQDLYNQNPNRSLLTGHFEVEATKYSKDSIPKRIKQNLEESREHTLKTYNDLLSDNLISKEFYELVSIDQHYFYAGAQTSIALLNYLLSERKMNFLTEEEYTDLWEEAFQSNPVSNPALMRSPWFFYYVKSYLWYKDLVEDNIKPEALLKIKKQELPHTYHIELAKTYLAGKQLEYYYAAYLYMEAISQNYEKELVRLFELFKEAYPSSEYTQFIASEIIPIIAFHRKQDEELNEHTYILENPKDINSLKDAVHKLNAQRVYVDIWATWCAPCKKEFEYNSRLYQLLENEDTAMLYISVDKDDRAEKWMEMIKYYQLEGYHIRANEKLYDDIKRLRGEDRFGIPWHFLMDGEGNIIQKYMSGPSEINTLKKQLQGN